MNRIESAKAYGLVFSLLGIAACAMVFQFSVVTSLAFILGERIYLYAIFTGCFFNFGGLGVITGKPSEIDQETRPCSRSVYLVAFRCPGAAATYSFIWSL